MSDVFDIMPAPPLSFPAEELRALALRAVRENDPEAEDLALRGIYRLILRIARTICRKLGNRFDLEEDLFLWGLYYATRYLRNYDGSSAVTTYISVCVHGMVLRQAKALLVCEAGARIPVKEQVPEDSPLRRAPVRYWQHHRHATKDHLVDVIPSAEAAPTDRLAAAEERAQLKARLARLIPVRRDVIRRRYGIGRKSPQTLEAVGAALGRSRERVRQIQLSAEHDLGIWN